MPIVDSICACGTAPPQIYEGTLIRTLRRLEEVLRQFATASKIVGNAELEQKFEEGIKRIKRDVVFSASLFL